MIKYRYRDRGIQDMKILKVLVILVILMVLAGAGYIGFMMITDYKPEETVYLDSENDITSNNEVLQTNTEYSALTFNIGYCGLDKGQDFFLDGGTMSRSSSEEKTQENLDKVITYLKEIDPNFMLLQEVDVKATRSFKVNQYESIRDSFETYESAFAINYKVPWVPVPLKKPHGNVTSGIATLSNIAVSSSIRYALPGKESFPKQLALLDRCFIESRIPVNNGKELILINAHLSAYDKGGTIRKQQLNFLRKFVTDAYEAGNYVVVGGDWNHLLPGVKKDQFVTSDPVTDWLQEMPEDIMIPEFTWGVDPTVPSNRANNSSFVKGVNFMSIIDGFLVSPNVEILATKGGDLDFEFSDHNPVLLSFMLKE